MFVIFVMF